MILMPTAIVQPLPPIRPEIGRVSFARLGGQVAVKFWRAYPMIRSVGGRIEEIRGEIPSHAYAYLATGLIRGEGEVFPVNQRSPQVLIVGPQYLPKDWQAPEDLSRTYHYLALCTDLFERTGQTSWAQKRWLNLNGPGDEVVKGELFRAWTPKYNPSQFKVGLLNLTRDNGTLKAPLELGQDLANSLAANLAAQFN